MEDYLFFPETDRRTLKVICIALPAGVVLMALVAVFVGSGETTPTDTSGAIVALRLIHIAILGAALLAQKLFYQRILERNFRLSGFLTGLDSSFSVRYRIATIVKLALFE